MDVIDAIYQRLEEAIEQDGPLDTITVGDLYQQLVPYRAVRADLGLWELAQYEHALLRLLSGERGYLHLEDETARHEIARELSSPNPILGVYRDYASVRLRVGAREDLPILSASPAVSQSASVSPPPPPPAPAPAPAPDSAPVTPAAECRHCREPLPADPELRFCPACGTDQTLEPCAACGSPMRQEWNFCIRCGQRRDPRVRAG